jgi:hypothetical protein
LGIAKYEFRLLSDRLRAIEFLNKFLCDVKPVLLHLIVFDPLFATGVELISMLITRKLLILGTATTAKNPIAQFIVRLLYENAFALESHRHNTVATVPHRFVGMEKKAFFLSHLSKAPRFRPTHSSQSAVTRVDTWPE